MNKITAFPKAYLHFSFLFIAKENGESYRVSSLLGNYLQLFVLRYHYLYMMKQMLWLLPKQCVFQKSYVETICFTPYFATEFVWKVIS